MARLPFLVPNDPVVESIAERLRRDGRDPFREHQLPEAIIRFRQGFGRLIRRRTDRGLFVVVDPRLRTRLWPAAFSVSAFQFGSCETWEELATDAEAWFGGRACGHSRRRRDERAGALVSPKPVRRFHANRDPSEIRQVRSQPPLDLLAPLVRLGQGDLPADDTVKGDRKDAAEAAHLDLVRAERKAQLNRQGAECGIDPCDLGRFAGKGGGTIARGLQVQEHRLDPRQDDPQVIFEGSGGTVGFVESEVFFAPEVQFDGPAAGGVMDQDVVGAQSEACRG